MQRAQALPPARPGQSPPGSGYHPPPPSPAAAPLPLRAHPGDGQRGAEIFTAHQTKTPRRRAAQDHRVRHSGGGGRSLPADCGNSERRHRASPSAGTERARLPAQPALKAGRGGGMSPAPLALGELQHGFPSGCFYKWGSERLLAVLKLRYFAGSKAYYQYAKSKVWCGFGQSLPHCSFILCSGRKMMQ